MKRRVKGLKRPSIASRIKTRSEAKAVLARLFRHVDGIRISKVERLSLGDNDNQGLTYGEIDCVDFMQLLDLASPREGEVFVDLGSGTGKAIFTAALVFQFSKCIGIEILQGLHDTSVQLSGVLDRYLQDPLPLEGTETTPIVEADVVLPAQEEKQQAPDHHPLPRPSKPSCLRLPPIELRRGDLRTEDWSEADIVFVASLLFPDDLLSDLTELVTRLRSGSRILTLKKLVERSELVLVTEAYYRMSWERAKVYMYRRV